MRDLQFGEICVCDLSRSLNTTKAGAAPLIFLDKKSADNSSIVYRFCRVGERPTSTSRYPFIPVTGEKGLRNNCAVYPTQSIYFTDESALKKVVGKIRSEEILTAIQNADRKQKKRESVAIVMTLCPRCRHDFMLDPQTIVKRADPLSGKKEQCDFCQTRNGFLYFIYKKNTFRSKNR